MVAGLENLLDLTSFTWTMNAFISQTPGRLGGAAAAKARLGLNGSHPFSHAYYVINNVKATSSRKILLMSKPGVRAGMVARLGMMAYPFKRN